MVTTFKETLNGFYCAECRMSFTEPQTTCPYCGSIVTNYEELVTQKEPPEIIVGGRWWEEQEPEEELTDYQKELLDKLHKAVRELRDSILEGENENESNIS